MKRRSLATSALISATLLHFSLVQAQSARTTLGESAHSMLAAKQDSPSHSTRWEPTTEKDFFNGMLRLLTTPPAGLSSNLDVSALNGLYVFSSAGGSAVGNAVSIESRIGGFEFDGQGGFILARVVHSTSFGNDTRQFTGRYVVDDPRLGAITLILNTGTRLRAFLTDGGNGFVFADINSFGAASAGFARKVQ